PASDVFSFGLLAFETLTGSPAFREAPSTRLLEAIQFRDAQWPAGVRLPKDLRAVVEKCLEKRPRDRYEDARGVESDLAALLRFEPVSARPRGRLSRLLRRAALRPGRLAPALSVPGLAAGALLGRGDGAAARRFEAEARLEEARRLFVQGDLAREESVLRDLVARGDPPPGACGFLADRLRLRGDDAAALGLYRREIARGAATPAARIGAALSESRLPRTGLPDPARLGQRAAGRG